MSTAAARSPRVWTLSVALLLGSLTACETPPATVSAPTTPTPPTAASEQPTFSQTGRASWYGHEHQGQKTAGGERFDPHAMTAAHRELPFNTVARVTHVASGKTVKVRINDRGPFAAGRVIDISEAAGAALGIKGAGAAEVRVEVFASDQRSGNSAAAR